MNQTVAGAAYNNHVKESLLSGKPVEFSMKDFITDGKPKKKTVHRKQAADGYNMTIEGVLSYSQTMFNIYHDEQKRAEQEGNMEKALENWKNSQPHEILICKITGREYVCKIPR